MKKLLKRLVVFLPLNNPENPLQISNDKNLLQFSTKASKYPYRFEEGNYEIPYNFIEFIERKNNKKGFSQTNANIVINSTK